MTMEFNSCTPIVDTGGICRRPPVVSSQGPTYRAVSVTIGHRHQPLPTTQRSQLHSELTSLVIPPDAWPLVL